MRSSCIQARERVRRVADAMPTHVLHSAIRSVYGKSAPNAAFEADLRTILAALDFQREGQDVG